MTEIGPVVASRIGDDSHRDQGRCCASTLSAGAKNLAAPFMQLIGVDLCACVRPEVELPG